MDLGLKPDNLARLLGLPTCMGTIETISIGSEKNSVRVYTISDVHAEFRGGRDFNFQWCQSRLRRTVEDVKCFTVLIIAGDIGSSIDCIRRVFEHCVEQYDLVAFVVGNHDVWVENQQQHVPSSATTTQSNDDLKFRKNDVLEIEASQSFQRSSFKKIRDVVQCAQKCGVRMNPVRIARKTSSDASKCKNQGGKSNIEDNLHSSKENNYDVLALLMPLWAWYHKSWDEEPVPNDKLFHKAQAAFPFEKRWMDNYKCKWLEGLKKEELPELFGRLNEANIAASKDIGSRNAQQAGVTNMKGSFKKNSDAVVVLSYSHFLPRQELCPEKRFLTEPLLSTVIGSSVLEKQVQKLRPDLHVYGHTHIPMDLTLDDGITYVQWPLGYPIEGTLQCKPVVQHGPLLVFDSELGRGSDGIPKVRHSQELKWSKYYRTNERRAATTTEPLAPWTQRYLKRLID